MAKSYDDHLKHPKWQKKRLEILQRDAFSCTNCGDEESQLQIHHKKYVRGRMPWEYDDWDFTTLCEHCHELITKHIKAGQNPDCFDVLKVKKDGKITCYVLTQHGITRHSFGDNSTELHIEAETLKRILHFVINNWLKHG